MNTHNNARLTPKGREDMVRAVVDRGLSKAEAARQFNTTPKTVAKWVARFKAEGVVGLRDRSSKPLSSPSQISLATADAVVDSGRLQLSRPQLLVTRVTKHSHLRFLLLFVPGQDAPSGAHRAGESSGSSHDYQLFRTAQWGNRGKARQQKAG